MPHLTLVEKGSEKSHRVEGSEVLVGRDPACGIFLEGDEAKTVSGRHARFFFDDTKWLVEDAGSRNGTYVGPRKLEPGVRHAPVAAGVARLAGAGPELPINEAVGRPPGAPMLKAPGVPAPAHAAGTVPMR